MEELPDELPGCKPLFSPVKKKFPHGKMLPQQLSIDADEGRAGGVAVKDFQVMKEQLYFDHDSA